MPEPTTEAPQGTATDPNGNQQQQQQDQQDQQQDQQGRQPTETVDFWKGKAREQEKRAKDNAAAARELAQLKESQKTEAEKMADRIAKADSEVQAVPARVADSLRTHLVALHEIDPEDAELFLTANEPELLLKQVTRLLGQTGKRRKQGNKVPAEGTNPTSSRDDPKREFLRTAINRG